MTAKKKVNINISTEIEFFESGLLLNNYMINHWDILHFNI